MFDNQQTEYEVMNLGFDIKKNSIEKNQHISIFKPKT